MRGLVCDAPQPHLVTYFEPNLAARFLLRFVKRGQSCSAGCSLERLGVTRDGKLTSFVGWRSARRGQVSPGTEPSHAPGYRGRRSTPVHRLENTPIII